MKPIRSEFAIERIRRINAEKKLQRELRKYRIKMLAWALADALAMVVLVISITALAMLDSVSLVPGIVFGITVILLVVYGAIRGVLG